MWISSMQMYDGYKSIQKLKASISIIWRLRVALYMAQGQLDSQALSTQSNPTLSMLGPNLVTCKVMRAMRPSFRFQCSWKGGCMKRIDLS